MTYTNNVVLSVLFIIFKLQLVVWTIFQLSMFNEWLLKPLDQRANEYIDYKAIPFTELVMHLHYLEKNKWHITE